MKRSKICRLHISHLEQVQHEHAGQEWVPHWHDEWSFGAILEGQCNCSVAGQPFVARSGDLIAIAPGVIHTGALTAPMHQPSVLVSMLYVPSGWLARQCIQPPPRSGSLHVPSLAKAARQLVTALDAQKWLAEAVPVITREFLRDIAHPADILPSPAVKALIARVQTAVLAGEQTVSGLAQQCSVSRERIHRVLREWVGIAPSDYLRAVRLHRAKQLILGGESVASVAAECGFADQAHFTRWFRRAFGYTPGDLQHARQCELAPLISAPDSSWSPAPK